MYWLVEAFTLEPPEAGRERKCVKIIPDRLFFQFVAPMFTKLPTLRIIRVFYVI